MASEKIARVASKLEDSLKAGDYYAALQLYRTMIKRCVSECDLWGSGDVYTPPPRGPF